MGVVFGRTWGAQLDRTLSGFCFWLPRWNTLKGLNKKFGVPRSHLLPIELSNHRLACLQSERSTQFGIIPKFADGLNEQWQFSFDDERAVPVLQVLGHCAVVGGENGALHRGCLKQGVVVAFLS